MFVGGINPEEKKQISTENDAGAEKQLREIKNLIYVLLLLLVLLYFQNQKDNE